MEKTIFLKDSDIRRLLSEKKISVKEEKNGEEIVIVYAQGNEITEMEISLDNLC